MSDLSLVIPTHERKKDLRRLLSSIEESLHFIHLELQVIVVDSSDQASLSQNEILSWKRHPRLDLEYLRSTKTGVNGKRNQGLAKAKAPVTLFLDDDCEVSSSDLFTYHLHLHRENKAVLIGGSYDNHPSTRAAKAYCRIHDSWNSRPHSVAPFVGGNLSLKTDPDSPWLRFDESLHFGGTEKELVLRASSLGHPVKYSRLLTVDHHVKMRLRNLIRKAFYQGLGESVLWERYAPLLQEENKLTKESKTSSSFLESLYDFFFHVGYVHGQLGEKSRISFPLLMKALYYRVFLRSAPVPEELTKAKKVPPSVVSLMEARLLARTEQFYCTVWNYSRLFYGYFLVPWAIRLLKPYFFTRYQIQTRVLPLWKHLRKN